MADLNGGATYHVAGFFTHEKPDDLGIPGLAKPADGDTISVRDNRGTTRYRFIKGCWYDVGFIPPPERPVP